MVLLLSPETIYPSRLQRGPWDSCTVQWFLLVKIKWFKLAKIGNQEKTNSWKKNKKHTQKITQNEEKKT